MGFTVIIPARYASNRLPGKVLLPIAGEPMIHHAYLRAIESAATRVVIATEDARIRDVAMGFGAEVCMTARDHRCGSERVAEAITQLDLDDDHVVVNLQGDEPLLPAVLIDQVAALLHDTEASAASMATLATPCEASAFANPHVVKVVCDVQGRALYFSRAAIPYPRTDIDRAIALRHVGIYAYRSAFLQRFIRLSPSPYEQYEQLEQLRALWHGFPIRVAQAAVAPPPGVDTAADLEQIRARMEKR